MNFETIRTELYENGLGVYIQAKVKERMISRGLRNIDLARRVTSKQEEFDIPIDFSPMVNYIGRMKTTTLGVFPVYPDTRCSRLSATDKLKRVAIILDELDFKVNEEIIERLGKTYGEDFIYPPIRKQTENFDWVI